MGDKLVLRFLGLFETIKCTLEQAHGVPPCSVALHNTTLEDKNSCGYPSAKTVRSIAHDSASLLSYQELPTRSEVWRGHGQEAKRGEVGGPRITRHVQRWSRCSSRVEPLECPCSRCGA